MTKIDKTVLSWALYDWANSAFATTIMAGFFPLFFKTYWAGELASTESTFYLGLGNSIAGVLILIAAPLLGALADRLNRKKSMLIVFALFGIVMSAMLFWVEKAQWLAAIAIYCAAVVGFMGANIFYDAMLVSVIRDSKRDFVSAFGYALGYLGGGILFSINVAMTLEPSWFGIASAAEAVRFSFLSVAAWWFIFSIPLFICVADGSPRRLDENLLTSILTSIRAVTSTTKDIMSHKIVALFLLAYWFYIDGLDTIVRMALDYGIALGLEQNDLIVALILTQFVGFPATLLFGYIAQRGKTINGLYLGICAYILFVIWAFYMEHTWEFFTLAVGIGLVQGSVQALSRSYYASLIPPGQSAEYFGFYNMMGKSAVIIGPLLIGFVSLATGSHRWGMLSVVILFIIGGFLLIRVDRILSKAH
jgi:UMF1 family MFS transporter